MAVPWSTHIHWLRAAWHYYRRARNKYDVHSPFLADWIAKVVEDKRFYYAFKDIERVKSYWACSLETVSYTNDPGAGSRAGQGSERRVSDMVRWSAIEESAGKLLFRMLLHAKAETILELGTNLGFSAMYLRAAARKAKLITIEGQPEVATLAKESFQQAKLPEPDIRVGTFLEMLPQALIDLETVDFAWLDGDHRGEATLQYFEQIRPYLHTGSVVVVGDIHWSADMESAWDTLKEREDVTLSVDLFHFGVLFFRDEQKNKEDYTLIKTKWKPWRMGFLA